MNVAVGGTNGFIPDGANNRGGVSYFQKPWSNGDPYVTAMKKFYDNFKNWKWTWDSEGDNNAMQIDYIRVYQKKTRTEVETDADATLRFRNKQHADRHSHP